MEFTTSNGVVVPENVILKTVSRFIKTLKQCGNTDIIPGIEQEILEWYLNKKIEYKKDITGYFYIKLHEDITEEDLEQLEQLKDYLEL